MTDLTTELDHLHDRILGAEADTRYLFRSRLAELIGRMDTAEETVPPGIRQLLEELTAEAIEAQFDNMPV